jgi:hypothetical protein
MTLIFKGEMPSVVHQVLSDLGWQEFDDKIQNEDEWNILWKPTRQVNNKKSNFFQTHNGSIQRR